MSVRRATRRTILLACATLAVVLLLVELLSFAAVSLKLGRIASARTLFLTHLTALSESGGCSWGDSVAPDPYLGFRYTGVGACPRSGINSDGLLGQEMPLARHPGHFTILVLGGSVAEQFAQNGPHGMIPLEEELNVHYVSPTRRPFRVLNGAIAAGQQPMQAIAVLMYGDRADAVISLEGYNEYFGYAAGRRIETPAHIWFELMRTGPIERGALFLYRYARSSRILSRSYASFALTYGFAQLAYESALKREVGLWRMLLPTDQSGTARNEHYLRAYEKYLASIVAVSRARGMKAAFFLQPVPALFKQLTPEERSVVGDLAYGKGYAAFVDALLAFRNRGIPVFSLLDAFQAVHESLYVFDPIHLDNKGPGNTLIARAMAKRLASEWGLKSRDPR